MAKKSADTNSNNNPASQKKNKLNKAELEQALIDNFISLQRVMTNLSIKFDDLSSNISKLLQLFEISAKSFAEKYSTGETKTIPKVDEEFLKKLDSLLDQNKTIAKAIMMMEEKVREKQTFQPQQPLEEENIEPKFTGISKTKPLPRY